MVSKALSHVSTRIALSADPSPNRAWLSSVWCKEPYNQRFEHRTVQALPTAAEARARTTAVIMPGNILGIIHRSADATKW